MPDHGTWKLFGSTAPMTGTGDVVITTTIPGYPGAVADLSTAAFGIYSGQAFSALGNNPTCLYLDGATTPSDYEDLPSGWTPDPAYVVWIGTWNMSGDPGPLGVTPSLRVQIDALDLLDATIVVPPPIINVTTALPPRTGMTLLKLIAAMGWPVVLTLTAEKAFSTTQINQLMFGGGAERDPSTPEGDFVTKHGIAWLEGTYHIETAWWKLAESCAHPSSLRFGPSPGPPYTAFDPDDSTAHPTPTIMNIVPSHGPLAGGTPVLIRGSGFGQDARVTFDGVDATDVGVLDTSTISCTTPPHDPGPVTVVVTNVDGVSS